MRSRTPWLLTLPLPEKEREGEPLGDRFAPREDESLVDLGCWPPLALLLRCNAAILSDSDEAPEGMFVGRRGLSDLSDLFKASIRRYALER